MDDLTIMSEVTRDHIIGLMTPDTLVSFLVDLDGAGEDALTGRLMDALETLVGDEEASKMFAEAIE